MLSWRVGDETTVGGVDCVSSVQHSQSHCPCLSVRHVTAACQLQAQLSAPHDTEHPPVSLLRQLRRQLSPVQRVGTYVPPRHDALRSKLPSRADNQRLCPRPPLVLRCCGQSSYREEPCHSSEKYTTDKISTCSLWKRLRPNYDTAAADESPAAVGSGV